MKLLIEALAKAQSEFPKIVFDATNPHFKNRYASLANILACVTPTLSRHKLVLTGSIEFTEKTAMYSAKLYHPEHTEFLECQCPIIVSKNDAQGFGSGLTYAKRYAVSTILNIAADDDDDAEIAVSRASPQSYPQGNAKPASSPQSSPQITASTNYDEQKNDHKAKFKQIMTVKGIIDLNKVKDLSKKLNGYSFGEISACLPDDLK